VNIATIYESAGSTNIDAGFTPTAVAVGEQLAPDMRRRFSSAPHER
jgi:hypothetical protein